MSSSQFDLRAVSEDSLAILEIASANYELLAQAPGQVECRVDPGLYIVRAKSLDRVVEKVVRVRDSSKEVRVDAPRSASGLSSANSEATLGAIVNASRSSAQNHWISVAIRSRENSRRSLPRTSLAVSEFSVQRLDGTPVASFVPDTPEYAPSEESSVGEAASIELEPGWYAFCMPSGGRSKILIPLFVADRFSPTVFVEARSNFDETGVDYDRLLVSYDGREVNSYIDPMRIYAVEMARRSLELGRNTLASPLMNVLLSQKFEDPTLGLLAMRLLLMDAGVRVGKSEEMFNTVVDNMAAALGAADHPDLVLAREYARKKKWNVPAAAGDNEPLIAPPLLRANWNSMLEIPARRKELERRHSGLYEIGESLIRAGVWVAWKPSIEPKRRAWSSGGVQGVLQSHAPIRGQSIADAPYAEVESTSKRERVLSNRKNNPRSSPLASRADNELEHSVDMVRRDSKLHDALRDSLASQSPTSTVLDRTVVRAVLQLAEFELGGEQSVPPGYTKQMASALSLPLPLVKDSISRVSAAIRTGRFHDDTERHVSGISQNLE